MHVPFSPPDIGEKEIELVSEVLRSGWITTGPKTKELERALAQYYGRERVACLNSATAAMELSLRILGIGPGDEVITSAYTYSASASVIAHVGAKVVLADCMPDSCFIDPEKIRAAITPRTKAVIPVDIAGIPADYDAIRAVLEDARGSFQPASALQRALGRIAIVGDCAHSMGALWHGESAAKQPDIACFSFHAVKNFTTAEGGAAAFSAIGEVSAESIYKQFMLLSLHGQTKDALAKTEVGAWEYDIVSPAFKCNMTDIMAAIGLAQLARYPEMLARRKALCAIYDSILPAARFETLQHETADYCSCRHMYFVRVKGAEEAQRNAIIKAMGRRDVSANVHYKPLPMLTAYRNMGFDIADYPNAFALYQNEITLPLFSLMTDEQCRYTAQTLLEATQEVLG